MRVAIIGAGLGGLAAAVKLRQRTAADFIIFELATETGERHEFDVVISAMGLLSVPRYPDWPGWPRSPARASTPRGGSPGTT